MIPQHFIDDLLARVDIVDVIDTRVSLRKAGREYKACCPFHDEKTPSFTVSPNKQFYHCFGCGEHGTAIGFLMAFDRMSFPEAVEELARDAGMTVPNEARSNPQQVEQQQTLLETLQQADRFYRRQLREHKQSQRAVDYLKGRGLTGEVAARFGLGLAPPGWDNLLSELGTDNHKQELMLACGLLIKKDQGGFYDRFRDRIMFPIHDYRGRIVGFGGRLLPEDKADAQGSASAAGDRKSGAADAQGSASAAGAGRRGAAKYLNSPETALFHKGREMYGLFQARDGIKQAQQVLVVEGYMDVVALAQFGIDFAVATLGTATTRDHLDRLFRYTPEVVFCFDGDRAGRSAAWRALEVALPIAKDGRQISFLFLPDGEDPDSQIRKIGHDAFLADIRQATSLPDFFFQQLGSEVDLARMDGRARLVELARPLLGSLPMGALRELMVQKLSEISRVDAQKLSTLVGNIEQQRGKSRPEFRSHTGLKPKPSPIQNAINLLLQDPGLAGQVSRQDLEVFVNLDRPGAALLVEILDFIEAREGVTTARILEHYRGSEHHPHLEKLSKRRNIGVERGMIDEQDGMVAEFRGLIDRLHQQAQRQRRRELAHKEDLTPEEKDELRQLAQSKPDGKSQTSEE